MASGCCRQLSICRTVDVCRRFLGCVQVWLLSIRLALFRLCSKVVLRVALLLRFVAVFVLLRLLARVRSFTAAFLAVVATRCELVG